MVLVALFLPLWVFIVGTILYALMYVPYEILFLALCIDAQFGDPSRGLWFLYTLSTAVILVASVFIKPQLRFYK
jgi:hypothetical protein